MTYELDFENLISQYRTKIKVSDKGIIISDLASEDMTRRKMMAPFNNLGKRDHSRHKNSNFFGELGQMGH
jgi:hypothetical protein